MKRQVINKGSDFFNKKKKAFNEKAKGYKIRICNKDNLSVYAIRKNNGMIIYPTLIKVGDVVVDERDNRFYVSKTTEIDDFVVVVDDEETMISVVELEFDQRMLSELTLTDCFRFSNSIENSVVNTGNVETIVVQANNNNLSNVAYLSIEEYWKKLRCELKYNYDNKDYSFYINEVEKAFREKRKINPRIQDSVLKKVSESVRGFIIDFGSKFLAELLKNDIK